ncbi:MAG: hypothetical protein QM736_14185 [Vicinamibacterales bacterium]
MGDEHRLQSHRQSARRQGGRLLREYMLDFPGTLRMEGPESNSQLNYTIGPMVYESLVNVHPTTLAFLPPSPPTGKSPPTKPPTASASTPTPAGPTDNP